MAENIEVKVQDKVSPTISTKLQSIASNARGAHDAVKTLQSQLAALNANSLKAVLNTPSSAAKQLQQAALASQKLITEQHKSAAAAAAAAAAQTKANTATTQGATAQQQLAAAQAKTNAAMQQAAAAAQRLATEQHKTAAAAAAAAAAQIQANTAATQGATAQAQLAAAQAKIIALQQQAAAAAAQAAQKLATEQQRTVAAQQAAANAAQRLATEQQRTAAAQQAAAQAAQRLATEQHRTAAAAAAAQAAADRAALAQLRLQQAMNGAAGATRNAGSQLAGYIRTAAGLAGVGLSANAILSSADAYVTLQNKLQNVAKSQEQVNKLTDELFDLANKTRSGVQETATAFARFDRALAFMGKSQTDTLRLTETINKALIVGGATAAEAGSALLQLSQGFNAGKLQGDEFRAVAENMPMVLDAVAKALKVPVNRVKELSSQGKITSEVLFEAFSLIQKSVDETFAKTTPTIGQSLTVLKNKATQFFGELNKSVGFTNALSNAILFLSNNLDIVTAVVGVVGVAFAAYFGSTVVNAIKAATLAMRAFTVAILTNPVALLIVGISSAVIAIALFGDKIKVTSDGLVTLKDVALSVWSFIKDGASAAAELIQSVWGTAIDWINSKTNGWGEQFRNIGEAVMKYVKMHVNVFIASWVATYNAIKVIWNNFPALMKGIFASVVNAGASAVETLLNSWQIGLRMIAKASKGVAPEVAETINSSLDTMSIKLPRMNVDGDAKNAAGQIAQAFTDAFSKDYVGDAANAVMNRAREIADKRRLEEAKQRNAELRGAGVNQTGETPDKKAAAAAERRALAMEKINTELDNELSRMFQLQPQREAQAKFDQIEESLIQKKIKLTDSEKTAIMGRIKAVQDATEVQRQFDAIYSDAVGPLREYNATLDAAKKLVDMGAISQEQAARATLRASEAYANAKDPMREHNRDLQQQLDLLKMLPKQREIEQQVMQVQNDMLAKGIVLNAQELAQLREKLRLQQQLNAVSQQEASLLDGSVGKRQQEIDQMTAINKLLADRASGFTKSDALGALSGSEAGQYLTGSPEMINAQVEQLGLAYGQIEAMRQADLISEQTAAAAKMQIWNAQQNAQLSTAKTFFGSLEGLQNSSNSKMARIGKAAAIANAIVNTYQSATGAYASLASIPYVGPALGAAAAAAAIAAGMANVAAIRSQGTGFKSGGYTGNMATDEVAGVVHGREFVMNAAATSRIGVANLQALQSGAANVNQNAPAPVAAPGTGSGGAGNAAAGGQMTTNIRNINVLDPAIVGEYMASADGEQVFINTMRRNSEQVRQIIQNG